MLKNLSKVQELIAKAEPGLTLRSKSKPKLLSTNYYNHDKLRIFTSM